MPEEAPAPAQRGGLGPGPGPGRPGSHQRYNKACDSCHVSKVRCAPDPRAPDGTTCRRCARNATPCVFSPVGPRRRPLRTKNDRIAELERRVRDMQLQLERQVEKRTGSAVVDAADDAHGASAQSEMPLLASPAKASGPRASGAGPGSGSGPDLGSSAEPASGFQPPLWNLEDDDNDDDDDDDCAADTPRVPSSAHVAPSSDGPPATAAATNAPGGSSQPSPPTPLVPPDPDIIDRGLITQAQADSLIREFRTHLDGKLLGISLPDDDNDNDLRRARPTLWLSILSSAATGSTALSALCPVLFDELRRRLDAVLDAGPDLEALQALVHYSVFHYDPVSPLGAQMVRIFFAGARAVVRMAEQGHDDDDLDVELARAVLHWYWMSLSLGVKSRRATHMLRRGGLARASLRVLQRAGASRRRQRQHDLSLVQWAELVRIAAETVLALHRGHTQEAGGLSDEARDEIVEAFDARRKRWLAECPFDLVNEPLMLEYHYYVLLISEMVYPAGPADFRKRSYGLPSLTTTTTTTTTQQQPPDHDFLASYKLPYTRKCITAAHACLDIATNNLASTTTNNTTSTTMIQLLRRCGILYGRIFYALRLLLLVAHEVWRTRRHDLVDVDAALRIDAHLAALKRALEAAAVAHHGGGTVRFRVPSLWLYAVTTRIEPWYQRLRTLLAEGRRTSIVPPPPPPSGGRGEKKPRAETAGDGAGDGFYVAELFLPPDTPLFASPTYNHHHPHPFSTPFVGDSCFFFDPGAFATDACTNTGGGAFEDVNDAPGLADFGLFPILQEPQPPAFALGQADNRPSQQIFNETVAEGYSNMLGLESAPPDVSHVDARQQQQQQQQQDFANGNGNTTIDLLDLNWGFEESYDDIFPETDMFMSAFAPLDVLGNSPGAAMNSEGWKS